MSHPSIEKRLEQIREYGLPHLIRPGNTLPKICISSDYFEAKPNYKIIGCLEGRIPEIVMPSLSDYNPFPFFKFDITKGLRDESLQKIMASAAGKDIPQLAPTDLEVHAFYDPFSDVTHYFLLPPRTL